MPGLCGLSVSLSLSCWVFHCLFFLGSSGRIEIWFALHLSGEFAFARFDCVFLEGKRGGGNINIIFGSMWILIAAARKLGDTNYGVSLYVLRVGAWQQKIYICVKFLPATMPYTKLIKIQLGKKFFSLSNKYCKICRQTGWLDATPLSIESKAFAFAYASFLISWQSKWSISWSFPHAVPFVIWLPKFLLCVRVASPSPLNRQSWRQQAEHSERESEVRKERKAIQLKSK